MKPIIEKIHESLLLEKSNTIKNRKRYNLDLADIKYIEQKLGKPETEEELYKVLTNLDFVSYTKLQNKYKYFKDIEYKKLTLEDKNFLVRTIIRECHNYEDAAKALNNSGVTFDNWEVFSVRDNGADLISKQKVDKSVNNIYIIRITLSNLRRSVKKLDDIKKGKGYKLAEIPSNYEKYDEYSDF